MASDQSAGSGSETIVVPDIGDFDSVDVIEVLVSVGDVISVDDSLVTLESDKASMEVPSPVAGTVESIAIAVGDQVAQGAALATVSIETEISGEPSEDPAASSSASSEDETDSSDSAATTSSPVSESTTEAPAPAASRASAAATASGKDAVPEAPGDHSYDFDLVVLGSGPGGYAAAFRAADLGLKVALIERHATLGGVCLNVGCIPSKALLHAAKVIDEAASFADHGITFGKPEIDLDQLRSWKESVIGKLTGGLGGLAKRRKVEVITGVGALSGPHQVDVFPSSQGSDSDETASRSVTFHSLVLAVGSRVAEIPGIPYESERVWDSTGALELREVPPRLLVIGGGIIGLEMATVYEALGSEVSVVELSPELMVGADRDLVKPLLRRVQKRYANIWTSTQVTGVAVEGDELIAQFEGEKAPATAAFDAVLVAVGRRPNGDLITAENAGVTVTERGFIEVDAQQRTNVPHIFAIGDVVGQPMLAHKATHEGHVAAEVAAGLKSGFDARVIPSVAYTDPEVAWVGLTETAAKEQGIAYQKGVFPWAASGRALALGRDEGSTKLLFDPESHRLLGGGAVGPNAGDVIAEIGHAIEMGSDAADIALTVHAHPTLSETVGLAAEVFEGTVTDIYAPKKKRG